MACDEESNAAADAAIDAALSAPKRVRTAAAEVENHSIGDLIEADRYRRSKCAASRPGRGIRLTKLLPGGTE